MSDRGSQFTSKF
jgi:hypothetical protein